MANRSECAETTAHCSERSGLLWAFGIVGAVLLLIGSYGVFSVLVYGDMGSLTTHVPWGLWVGFYAYLVVLDAGVVLTYFVARHGLDVEGLEELGPLVFLTAFVALAGALTSIFHDLGQPFRIWRTFLTPDFGSSMAWMVWLHTIYMFFLIGGLLAYRSGREDVVNTLAFIIVPLALVRLGVLGTLFGGASAGQFWGNLLLPVLYLISALVLGAGALLLLHLLFSAQYGTDRYMHIADRLGRWFFTCVLIGIFIPIFSSVMLFYRGEPATTKILHEIMFGPYSWTLWVFHGFLGTLVPVGLLLAQLWMKDQTKRAWSLGIAAALMVMNFIMIPLNIVIPGFVLDYDHYLKTVVTNEYFPGLVEWLVVMFVVGLMTVLFAVGQRLVCKPFCETYLESASKGGQIND